MTFYQLKTRNETITYKTREFAMAAAAKLTVPCKIVAISAEQIDRQSRDNDRGSYMGLDY